MDRHTHTHTNRQTYQNGPKTEDLWNFFFQLLFLFLHWRSNWKKCFIGLKSLVSSGYVSLFVCLFVCLSVCSYVRRLAPLPFDLDIWFFAWAFVWWQGKNGIFFFYILFFLPSYAPFSIFWSIPCKLNWWLWEAQMR